MSIQYRRYKLLSDFERISDFLRKNFVKYQLGGNIPQPYLEYAHAHPYFNHKLTHRFGIWEEHGDIIAAVCYEMDLGECFFLTKRAYEYFKVEMIDYAEKEFCKETDGTKQLQVRLHDYENDLRDALSRKGYSKAGEEPITVFKYEHGFRERTLPDEFSIISLEDENEIQKIHNVLWKGFDHGDSPDDDLDCRLQMQSAPNFRKDLTTIIKAPDGEYACFAGMWMDGVNDFAYLEPLATDPKYRKMGLATIAVTESMKRTKKCGAAYCYGGANEFYFNIGFETVCHCEYWSKKW